MVKIVCWNIAKRTEPWTTLKRMRGVDIALLQEVDPCKIPKGVAIGPHKPWTSHPYDRWPTVVKLSGDVKVEWFEPVPLDVDEDEDKVAVSDLPTLAAAKVTPLPQGEGSIEPFIVISMYARWYWPHPLARNAPVTKKPGCGVIEEFADASAHRIISDLSGFIAHTNPANHRIIAAGDLNTIYGATKASRLEMPERMRTIFDRMAAIGMEFAGPQWPYGGRRANPTPCDDVPPDTRNVPTYLSPQQMKDMKANRVLSGNQLDYVFVSRGFHKSVSVHAMNKTPNEWGPSDHCRIVIEVG